METEFIQVLYILAKSVPVVAVLWLSIRYLLKKEDTYIQKINSLEEKLRSNEKETITLMYQLNNTLDKVVENDIQGRKEVIDEIKNLSSHLTRRINELKKEK